jgi:lipid-binding SYLF domain-containing protein
MNKGLKTISVLAVTLMMAAGCSTAPSTSDGRAELHQEVQETIAQFRQQDPGIEKFFNSSAGYAVFPSIGKGGLVLGGAYGRGELYENGVFTSYCDVTQGTIGLQIGGQAYSEMIFFENQDSLRKFKDGALAFAAQASAVAVTAGAAATMDYSDGVAVFVGDMAGLMAEASVGGQKFSVVSNSDATFVGDQRVDPNRNDYGVYGYADQNDPGWRSDSDYNRLYDTSRSKTIHGEVISITEFSPARDSQMGRQMNLRADDGQTYIVHLGPISYLDSQGNLRVREGDRVTVSGSTATFQGQDTLIAREVSSSDGKRLELRDSDGRSRWNLQSNSNFNSSKPSHSNTENR